MQPIFIHLRISVAYNKLLSDVFIIFFLSPTGLVRPYQTHYEAAQT